MADAPSNCPKCSAPMEEGFLADHLTELRRRPTEWVEGTPERSLFFGVRTGSKEKLPIISFRCTRCGYLEHYARDIGP